MVTKKEIAEYLGVSRTAVSLVLNNARNSTISDKTRERILQAARELGYKDISPVKKISKKICYVVYNRKPDDPRYMTDLKYLEQSASEHEYNLIFMNIGTNPNDFKRLAKYLEHKEADGVIVTGDLDDDILYTVEESGIPYIVYGTIDRDNVNIITPDSEKAAYEATRYLLDNGHERIALFTGSLDVLIHQQTYEGYKKALESMGISIDKSLIQVSREEDGYELAKRMDDLDIKYTAAFCVNTVIQFGALHWLKEKGVEVPGEISLVGYGYSELARLCNPQMTTFLFKYVETANINIERLIDIINGRDKERKKIFLTDLKMIEGGTVGLNKKT